MAPNAAICRRCLFGGTIRAAGLVCGVIAVGFGPGARAQTTFYVHPVCGNDAWAGTSPVCAAPLGPKRTIQAAINASVSGDTIKLADGTFKGAGNRNMTFGGRDLTVESMTGNPAACVIDCTDNGRAFVIQGETIAINGLTITNGYNFSVGFSAGGAIYAKDAILSIAHCVLSNSYVYNYSYYSSAGGAVALNKGAIRIDDCTFQGNSVRAFAGSANGGAVWVMGSAEVNNSLFLSNHGNCHYGGANGGALWVRGDVEVYGAEFASNSTQAFVPTGGALNHSLGTLTIAKSQFLKNAVSAPSSYWKAYGGAVLSNGDVFVADTVFQFNGAAVGNTIRGGAIVAPYAHFERCAFRCNTAYAFARAEAARSPVE